MALTGKKRLFADAVLAGKSNKDAAIAAGYSPATAAQSGSRLAKDPAIMADVAARRAAGSTPGPEAAAVPPRPDFNIALALTHSDPKTFLMAAMNDHLLDPKQRIDAAKALMPFTHKKLGEGGKKDQADEKAKTAAGRFGTGAPPKLVAAGGKKI